MEERLPYVVCTLESKVASINAVQNLGGDVVLQPNFFHKHTFLDSILRGASLDVRKVFFVFFSKVKSTLYLMYVVLLHRKELIGQNGKKLKYDLFIVHILFT